MIKLITIDVDGTLVTPLKRLTKANILAIEKAKKAGVHIALASGRPYSGMKPLVERLNLNQEGNFSVCQNGSYIFDNYTHKPLSGTFQNPIDLKIIDDLLKDFNVQISAMDHESFYTRHTNPNIYTKIDAKISKLPLQVIQYDDFADDKTFGRILIMGKKSEMDRLYKNMPQELIDNYYAVKTAPFLIEVMNKNTNKGYAISVMAQDLDINQDEIMSIGNEKNDIPMLEQAGFAVAMANAVPELKIYADYITKNNLQSGVGYAIEKLLANNLEIYK
ncbi:HAD family phosphatase [Anaerococcus sp. mt242]|uniref:Cof-type HAD-IIB family hydrolase n=1 Tax=Anaerococcus sp. mt242 TaxID=2661917 RepID=UPI0019348220|nr:Cof-type HAD-IIB family hydrolase [Anaerococcus sp. mt242]MBM0045537.1 HAD family phosphatase [Anaerococcus sp. mt242]